MSFKAVFDRSNVLFLHRAVTCALSRHHKFLAECRQVCVIYSFFAFVTLKNVKKVFYQFLVFQWTIYDVKSACFRNFFAKQFKI